MALSNNIFKKQNNNMIFFRKFEEILYKYYKLVSTGKFKFLLKK